MSMLDPFVKTRHDFDMGRATRRILRTYPSWQHQVAEAKRQARRSSRRAGKEAIAQELAALTVANLPEYARYEAGTFQWTDLKHSISYAAGRYGYWEGDVFREGDWATLDVEDLQILADGWAHKENVAQSREEYLKAQDNAARWG